MLNKLSVCSPDVVDTLYSSKSDLKHTTRFKKLFFKTRAMSVYYSCVYSSSLHFSRTFRTTEPPPTAIYLTQTRGHMHTVSPCSGNEDEWLKFFRPTHVKDTRKCTERKVQSGSQQLWNQVLPLFLSYEHKTAV